MSKIDVRARLQQLVNQLRPRSRVEGRTYVEGIGEQGHDSLWHKTYLIVR